MEVLTVSEIEELGKDFDRGLDDSIVDVEADVGKALRERGYVTREEAEQVIEWKMENSPGRRNSYLDRMRSVPDEFVELVTRAAFLVDDPTIQMKTLNAIPGIGFATATAFIAFRDPENYAVGDRYINEVMLGEPVQVSLGNYLELLEELRSVAPDGLPLRTVEKAYYQRYLDER